jgi:hypothetical protein
MISPYLNILDGGYNFRLLAVHKFTTCTNFGNVSIGISPGLALPKRISADFFAVYLARFSIG